MKFVFPPYVADYTIANPSHVEQHYVKIPSLISYRECDGPKIAHRVAREVRLLELLRKHPHEDIVKHMSCVVEGGAVAGGCLEKFQESLYDWTWMNREKSEGEKVLACVAAALRHLHQMGYCHNDISPSDIMFHEDGRVVIIDFDSCRPIGETLSDKFGTPDFRIRALQYRCHRTTFTLSKRYGSIWKPVYSMEIG